MDELRVEIRDESGVVTARQAGREMAYELGFGLADQTRLATAISELARNVVQYAKEGVCIIADCSDEGMMRISVTVEDHGPGIVDVEKAMQNGFSTSRGLGAGLPGTKRLVQDFDIESRPGRTKVSIVIARQRG